MCVNEYDHNTQKVIDKAKHSGIVEHRYSRHNLGEMENKKDIVQKENL